MATNYNDKIYFVLPYDMVTSIDLNSIEENSYEVIRKSVDGTLAIVEYKQSIQFMGGTYLTHQQALELMSTEAWTEPDPPNE